MAARDLGVLGTNSTKTAGTTLAVTNSTGAIIPAGSVLVVNFGCDNINSVTAPTLTLSTIGGVAPTSNHAATGSGVTTTAGSGIWHQCWRVLTTADIAIGATITTITSNQSNVVRAATIEGWGDMTATLRNTVVTATSTTGAPSAVTSGTALVANDLVIGCIAVEDSAVPAADVDTLNGTWDAVTGVATSGAGAATNIGVGIQDKTVNATGAQTFNATGASADAVACVFALVPGAVPFAAFGIPL